MSLTQALAALIVDTLPSADAREKARAGLLDFRRYATVNARRY